ncbi:MAG: ABC transporter ATP-binding protein/permease [Christensenellaceae bacterium]|jgi:ATP-binding cassette subfamily B protein|nr:ABC transporter ATP-binding protein/permease [Christensenellaceae bacterium]
MLKMVFRLKGWEWFWLAFAVGLIITSTYLDLTMPNYLSKMTDEIQQGENARQSYIWLNGGIMLSFAIGSAIVMIANNFIFAVLSSKVVKRLRGELFDKVNSFSEAEINKFSVASLLTRITSDIGQVREFFASAMHFLIKAPMMALGAGFMILGKSGQLSVATFIATGLLLFMVVTLVTIVVPKFKIIKKYTDDLNLASRGTLTGLRVVRAYNAESYQQDKFGVASNKLAKTSLFVDRSVGLLFPFISLLMCGLGLANWWIGSILMNSGAVDQVSFFSQIMIFTQYSVQIIMSFAFLVFAMIHMPRAMVSARRIGEVLNTEPTITDGMGGKRAKELEKQQLAAENKIAELEQFDNPLAVQFNGVNFRYPNAEGFVLKGINLDIKQGERIAFIGSTGCGKSTLINLIPRLYDATEGEIKLFGTNIKNYRLAGLRKRVAYIPQRAMLFHGTVRDNVAFGVGMNDNITDDDIWRALEIAQAKDFVEKLDGKLDFEIAQHGDNLSGGQKQRIAIARGIVRNPKIYIFDDTFSALDFETDAKLRHALAASVGDATQIVVAQRIGTVKNMDRIAVLENGVIVGIGKHKELLANCKVYKEIALSQLSAEELK